MVSGTTFTEAEERFIDASMDVVRAGAVIYEAEKRMLEAQEAAKPFGLELDLPEEVGSLIERTTQLLVEAAHRAGFEDGHPVVDSLYGAQEAIFEEMELQRQLDVLVAQKLTNDANPLV